MNFGGHANKILMLNSQSGSSVAMSICIYSIIQGQNYYGLLWSCNPQKFSACGRARNGCDAKINLLIFVELL